VKSQKRKTANRAAGGAALALYGAYLYLGLQTPLPGQDQDVLQGLAVEKHEFVTPDGLTLRLKRYAKPDGQPVLLCHGFSGNGFDFDLPREKRNMAVYLAGAGYDVWISSFRGCGREPYVSDGGDWRHSIDHLAIYDAPTLVDGITRTAGKKPFWIGHSMGGEVLYMYLQGVRFEDGVRVVSDPKLVKAHHESLVGGVTIGSPPAFWWAKPHPLHRITESRVIKEALKAGVRMMRRREKTSPRVYRIGGKKKRFRDHPRIIMALSRSPYGAVAYYRPNTDKETTTSLGRWGTDDVSAGMWVQLLEGLLNGDLHQHLPDEEAIVRYNYTEHMHLVSLPILFLTGNRDFANPAAIKRFGYETVASDMKKFVDLSGYGHTDLLMGRNVERDVYRLLSDWVRMVVEH
jgi:pimeloyl-ACP methyl ester carboxylesterase